MTFVPSSLGDISDAYGSSDINYYAQSMLSTWRQGRDVGDGLGFFDMSSMFVKQGVEQTADAATEKAAEEKAAKKESNLGLLPAVGLVGGVVSGLVAPIAGMIHEGKQAKLSREHDITLARQQRKTLKAQAELAAVEAEIAQANSASTMVMASWIGGSIMLVGLAGAGVFAISKAKERK